MNPAGGGFEFPELETSRVQLRLLTLEDAPAVQRHFADPEVTRYMDIEPCESLDEAREIIDFHLRDTGCRWGLFTRDIGKMLGTCGYHCWKPEPAATAEAEIGYDLARPPWGRGLMREVVEAVIPFGFESMQLARIYAGNEPPNHRSINLLRGLGFQAELREGMQWLSITRETWAARTACR